MANQTAWFPSSLPLTGKGNRQATVCAGLSGKPARQHAFSKPYKMIERDRQAAHDAWIMAGETFREKVERARSTFLDRADGDGRVIDFHALRHTYASMIVASGESVKVAQELARHSTPSLTIGRCQVIADSLPGENLRMTCV